MRKIEKQINKYFHCQYCVSKKVGRNSSLRLNNRVSTTNPQGRGQGGVGGVNAGQSQLSMDDRRPMVLFIL